MLPGREGQPIPESRGWLSRLARCDRCAFLGRAAALKPASGNPMTPAMPKEKEPPLYSWSIYRVRAKLDYLGSVMAADEQSAIEQAIREFGITNPVHQKRLVAQKRERTPPS